MQLNLQGILNSERLAITRALSFVENAPRLDMSLTDALFPHLGQAYRIGITGPPGAGKSSLVDRLIEHWRQLNKKVAVISVDPTSPFTGGAILGDRVRMGRHFADPGVFIRSMATRGSHGGLALKAQDAADVFDAAGYEVILFETVGVGQVELDVAQAADTTAVVLVPESGDDIQAMKAGLMEIADLFVINKGDRQGANQALAQINSMLEMRSTETDQWHPKAVKTSALNAEGVSDLMAVLHEHQSFLAGQDQLNRNFQKRTILKIREAIEGEVLKDFWNADRSELFEQQVHPENLSQHRPGEIIRQILKTS